MALRILRAGIVSAALVVAAATASAQEAATGPLLVSHPILAASVERLASESPSWRDAIAPSPPPAVARYSSPPDQGSRRRSTPSTLAQVHPFTDDQSRIDTVLIVMNLELLQHCQDCR